MDLRVITAGDYAIIRINQVIESDAEIDEVVETLKLLLKHKHPKVALSFTQTTYPYSKLLGLLVACYRKTSENNSKLAVIAPGKEFAEVIGQTKLSEFIEIIRNDIAEKKDDKA